MQHRQPVRAAAWLIVAMLTLATGCSTAEEVAEPVDIEWFVGFGTGTQVDQVAAQRQLISEFNASQDEIEMTLTVAEWTLVNEQLAERVEAGDAPDIIGPIGLQGSGAFQGDFLDLQQWVASGDLDVSQYSPAQVAAETDASGRITGLPFGVFPSLLFVDRAIFAEAGLALPPQRFGETYRGEPWDMDALRALAMELTVDANGRSADDPDFDPDLTVQWGFHHQFIDEARAVGSFFGAGELFDGQATIPDAWLASWSWYHDLIWQDHAAPDSAEMESAVLDFRNPFRSGRVAMAFTHTWYAGSMRTDEGEPLDSFAFAVVPEFEGQATSKLHADTFRIFEQTEHPDEAVEVLSFLLGDAAPELLSIYNSFPARVDLQPDFEATVVDQFPGIQGVSVIRASLEQPDIPSHEAPLPNFDEARPLLTGFVNQLVADPTFNIETEAEALRAELDLVFRANQ